MTRVFAIWGSNGGTFAGNWTSVNDANASTFYASLSGSGGSDFAFINLRYPIQDVSQIAEVRLYPRVGLEDRLVSTSTSLSFYDNQLQLVKTISLPIS